MNMTVYDQQCANEFAQLQQKLEKYFVEVDIECPYELPHTATFFQGMFGPVPDATMELFLAAGYRRNGDFLYTMHCKNCNECIPIRLYPPDFLPSRNQKRTRTKNKDVEVSLDLLNSSEENISLCEKFLQRRYPSQNNSGAGYYSSFFYNTIVTTVEINYRVAGQLLGVGVVDVGDNWMNAVYFYFDPDQSERSLGTFNILTMIDLCLKMKIDYLYLGYHIDSVSAMNYKLRFKPYFLFREGQWLRFGDKRSLAQTKDLNHC